MYNIIYHINTYSVTTSPLRGDMEADDIFSTDDVRDTITVISNLDKINKCKRIV